MVGVTSEVELIQGGGCWRARWPASRSYRTRCTHARTHDADNKRAETETELRKRRTRTTRRKARRKGKKASNSDGWMDGYSPWGVEGATLKCLYEQEKSRKSLDPNEPSTCLFLLLSLSTPFFFLLRLFSLVIERTNSDHKIQPNNVVDIVSKERSEVRIRRSYIDANRWIAQHYTTVRRWPFPFLYLLTTYTPLPSTTYITVQKRDKAPNKTRTTQYPPLANSRRRKNQKSIIGPALRSPLMVLVVAAAAGRENKWEGPAENWVNSIERFSSFCFVLFLNRGGGTMRAWRP